MTGFLATTAGFFGGMFCTAAALWFNERKSRRALQEVTDKLRENDTRVASLLREARDIIAIVGRDDTITYLSPAADRALGRSSARLVGTNPLSWVHPEDREQLAALLAARVGIEGDPGSAEFRVPHESGAWITLEAVSTNMLDDPTVDGIVLTCRDVTERKQSEAELREAQERFRSAFDYAPIGMALTSLEGRYFRVNRALAHMLGRADDELTGAPVMTLTHPQDRKASQEAMHRLIDGDIPGYRLEQRFVHSDGRPVWVSVSVSLVRDAEGKALYTVSQIEDITERRASGERLAHQAIHDPLTGLPNRTFFVDRLRSALNEGETTDRVAVLFIDLDHFKIVNDSLGHPAGDRLIVAIADRLRTATRPSDIIARFGGDEFTVLCTGVPDEEVARELAERISVAVAKPVALAEGEVFVTASIGIALSGNEMETPETLLRNADAAMYKAKDEGRARSAAYESGAHDRAVNHLRTGNDLHRALERGELCLHYQPIVSLDTGHISGFESLLRWEHPQRGLIGPGEFVELAEETGLVVSIGEWVLGEACRQAARWHDSGAMVTMSVNVSPRQLAEPTLPEDFARVLRETGVDPDAIWLEITENALMSDADAAVVAMEALRKLGVHLSVDDFGTGYSSMTYLKRFPVEALKIDRAFVDGIDREQEDMAICNAVVNLAHSLGVRCVAEGVETDAQLMELRKLGCDLGQGYLFGRPQPADAHGDRPDLTVCAAAELAPNGAKRDRRRAPVGTGERRRAPAHDADATLPTSIPTAAHDADATLPTSTPFAAHDADATLPTSTPFAARDADATLPTSTPFAAHDADATLPTGTPFAAHDADAILPTGTPFAARDADSLPAWPAAPSDGDETKPTRRPPAAEDSDSTARERSPAPARSPTGRERRRAPAPGARRERRAADAPAGEPAPSRTRPAATQAPAIELGRGRITLPGGGASPAALEPAPVAPANARVGNGRSGNGRTSTEGNGKDRNGSGRAVEEAVTPDPVGRPGRRRDNAAKPLSEDRADGPLFLPPDAPPGSASKSSPSDATRRGRPRTRVERRAAAVEARRSDDHEPFPDE